MGRTVAEAAREYERLVAGLAGQMIVGVDYFVLCGGEDGTEPEDWDRGGWHEPTMGVELLMADGEKYSAVWDHTFDYYGIELYRSPITDHVRTTENGGTTARCALTGNPAWAGIVSEPIESSTIQWLTDEPHSAAVVPLAIRLRTAKGQVWIGVGVLAGLTPDDRFRLATDDVFVAFGPESEPVRQLRELGPQAMN
ncbi:hypothetical protein ABH926_006692 [Catenulispora sp. GP43]|uniref:hypothetical protein n=1 Tax=Catenulispora sp. GP43 TaxID=3156263 RepID=UPI0035159825